MEFPDPVGGRRARWAILPALLLCGSGGSARANLPQALYKTHPALETRLLDIKSIVVLPAEVEIVRVSVGGVPERMSDWSETATKNILSAIEAELRRKVDLRSYETEGLPPALAANLKETQALFDAVNTSVFTHTYQFSTRANPNLFADKLASFEYSLGPEVRELSGKADAYLLVRGSSQVATAGRTAAATATLIVGAVFGVIAIPGGSPTVLSVGLVDAKTGDLLWHGALVRYGCDLLKPKDVADAVKSVLEPFPFP